MLVCVYSCQNATLLEITLRGSNKVSDTASNDTVILGTSQDNT